ncbi:hypothetical protein PQE75_gp172 [Bacillus phage vB_BcoS-136]|uniref:Uncharacterized protein n=1 Tax=Bacillus phage vB_BcoS-136 TaxID=2419619 RepID=A0A3G3BVN0_9CAUD|nr:hypothetical protein PQE75_gp172 [Bacillus phage vB_BcoS-136]AYP68307.1 hypothetical protein vBBcoS136_00193 [Bacillus phage vB_BcoS-136]
MRRNNASDVVGEFVKAMLGIVWYSLVFIFYMVLPWIFFYLIIKIFGLD